VAAVGLAALLLRLAILPFCPIPLPFVPNDFSFLLAADTFAHGRLTNPTPAMWIHFESIHITMQPTYMSMYFPSVGLVLAAGKVLFGNPWFGILISCALMCAAICWMLQAWLPPGWALLGGILAILRLGLFSYWINTYSAAARSLRWAERWCWARCRDSREHRAALRRSAGAALRSWPHRGPTKAAALPARCGVPRPLAALRKESPLHRGAAALERAAACFLIAAIGSWMAYYDYRAFGKARLRCPTPSTAPPMPSLLITCGSRRVPEPAYRHEVLRNFYNHNELDAYNKIHTWGLSAGDMFKVLRFEFYAGLALLPRCS
jgi:hypothetical protein